jgi:hypothetical protein
MKHISPRVSTKSFKKCCLSTAVDGTVGGSEQDGNVRSECKEDEGTDYEDGVSDTDWYR